MEDVRRKEEELTIVNVEMGNIPDEIGNIQPKLCPLLSRKVDLLQNILQNYAVFTQNYPGHLTWTDEERKERLIHMYSFEASDLAVRKCRLAGVPMTTWQILFHYVFSRDQTFEISNEAEIRFQNEWNAIVDRYNKISPMLLSNAMYDAISRKTHLQRHYYYQIQMTIRWTRIEEEQMMKEISETPENAKDIKKRIKKIKKKRRKGMRDFRKKFKQESPGTDIPRDLPDFINLDTNIDGISDTERVRICHWVRWELEEFSARQAIIIKDFEDEMSKIVSDPNNYKRHQTIEHFNDKAQSLDMEVQNFGYKFKSTYDEVYDAISQMLDTKIYKIHFRPDGPMYQEWWPVFQSKGNPLFQFSFSAKVQG